MVERQRKLRIKLCCDYYCFHFNFIFTYFMYGRTRVFSTTLLYREFDKVKFFEYRWLSRHFQRYTESLDWVGDSWGVYLGFCNNFLSVPWWNFDCSSEKKSLIRTVGNTEASTSWVEVIFRVKWQLEIQTNLVMLWSLLWLVVGRVMWLVVRMVSGNHCISIWVVSEGHSKDKKIYQQV